MLAKTITEIQSLGVKCWPEPLNRKVGAGPAEGGTLLVQDIPVHVPFSSNFVSKSPYTLIQENGASWLAKNSEPLLPAKLVQRPNFYDFQTEEKIPFSMIALLHGKDCLASTVIQTCVHWNPSTRCHFCGIELSLVNSQTICKKSPAQLAEVVARAKELDFVSHVVLTTGAAHPQGKEIDYIGECAKAIKRICDLPIHAQFLPPEDDVKLYELKEAGVDTVGVHIESFDIDILSLHAPVKAAIGFEKYEQTWNKAVEIFGSNQVSSFLLVGLGEKRETVAHGARFLAERGVYPFLVPFRPIPGSMMQDHGTPDPELMTQLYKQTVKILLQNGLSSSRSLAGCVRCGACSALHAYELEAKKEVVCRPVRNQYELEKAMEIRNEVFVKEQKLFDSSDFDENDPRSIHIIAEYNDEIIGVVRVFQEAEGSNKWVGGRLAVRKSRRAYRAGAHLVREAMRYVKKQGCTSFTAHIQERNVRFFALLGWKSVGPVKIYKGKPHQVMEADLDRV
ncbi:MAG: MSMEG_0568 family radical SAM protein [Desulfomonilaceae bacterium]